MASGNYRFPFIRTVAIMRRHAPFHATSPVMRHCIDWAMSQGTLVLAARAGIVVQAVGRYTKTYHQPGFRRRTNHVRIRHDDGQVSRYVHLAAHSVRVRVGQRVRCGQVIGRSGQTGYATYPHLHFGVYGPSGANIRIPWDRMIPDRGRWLTVRGARM